MLVLFTDTDTDLTPKEAKEFGYHMISMPYSIDGVTTSAPAGSSAAGAPQIAGGPVSVLDALRGRSRRASPV